MLTIAVLYNIIIYAEGKMFCHEDHALQLAALAILAEKGSTANHITHYRLEDYLPTRVRPMYTVVHVNTVEPFV